MPNIINGKLIFTPDVELINIINIKKGYGISFQMVSDVRRFVLILNIDDRYYELLKDFEN